MVVWVTTPVWAFCQQMKTNTTHNAGISDVYRRFFQGRQKQTVAPHAHQPHDEVTFSRHPHPSVADNPAVHEL